MKKTLVVAGLVAGLCVGALAGDGIPVGDAVFYPSVEAVYTHTDNLFLQDSTMPFGSESDSFWVIRPTLGIELPFKESFVRFDFGYQYKDYSTYDLKNHNTYNFDFKGLFRFSGDLKLTVDNHFIRGAQEVREFDPGYERVFSDTAFDRDELKVGLEVPLNRANALGIYGIYNYINFSNGSSDRARPFFDYKQYGGGVAWKYALSPTSQWVTSGEYLQSKPDLTSRDIFLFTNLEKKYDQTTLMTGWEGAHKEVLTGFFKVGWSRMKFNDNAYSDFSGMVADVGIGFQPAEAFKIDLTAGRHPYQSVYNVNNFYTSNFGQLQFHQELSRYFYWTAGYRYQQNDYPDSVKAVSFDPADPLAILPEFVYTQGKTRQDDINRAYAEVGYHFNKQFSMRANYQYEDRKSNIHYYDLGSILRRPYSYSENRFLVQAQIGW